MDINDIPAGISAVADSVSLTSEWSQIRYDSDFQSPPATFASIQTFNGGNTAGVRMRRHGKDGAEIRIEEEQSSDEDTTHEEEQVGYVALAQERVQFGKGNSVADVGTVTERQGPDSQWHTVHHDVGAMQFDPVVFAQLLTKNGKHPAHVRLRNVDGSSFEFQIEEWDYLNQHHTEEQLGYAVLPAAKYPIADGGVLEVGTTKANHEWTDVSLDAGVDGDTVVVTQCQTYNGGQAVVTRQRNVSSSGFEVRLQEEEANDDHHATETIGYVAATLVDAAEIGFGSGSDSPIDDVFGSDSP